MCVFLDNSVSFESGFGRFVPVRPQPRALPLNVQNRENISAEQQDDGTGSSISGHTLHPYAHQMQNGNNSTLISFILTLLLFNSL